MTFRYILYLKVKIDIIFSVSFTIEVKKKSSGGEGLQWQTLQGRSCRPSRTSPADPPGPEGEVISCLLLVLYGIRGHFLIVLSLRNPNLKSVCATLQTL